MDNPLITQDIRDRLQVMCQKPEVIRLIEEHHDRIRRSWSHYHLPPFVTFPYHPKPKPRFVETDVSVWNYLFIIAALIYVIFLAM